jgi:hypothetical protein
MLVNLGWFRFTDCDNGKEELLQLSHCCLELHSEGYTGLFEPGSHVEKQWDCMQKHQSLDLHDT